MSCRFIEAPSKMGRIDGDVPYVHWKITPLGE